MFGMGDAVKKDLEWMAGIELMKQREAKGDWSTNFSFVLNSVKYQAFVHQVGDERIAIYNIIVDGIELGAAGRTIDNFSIIRREWADRHPPKQWWKP